MFHRSADVVLLVWPTAVMGSLLVLVAGGNVPTAPAILECGIPQIQTMLIIDGKNATPDEFPWQVSLQVLNRQTSTWEHFCGGSVIDDQWILTAAHCIDEPYEWRIGLGKHNLAVDEPFEHYETTALSLRHPFYNKDHDQFDFALMKLSRRLNLTGEHANIAPICLPSAGEFNSFDDQRCIVSGWGATRNGTRSDVLQEATVQIMPFEKCRNLMATKQDEKVTRDMLCAMAIGQGDAAKGDSGGPLQCLRDNQYVLAGIVSFGYDGCTTTPGVYGRVSEALPWIHRVRNNH